MKDIVLERDNGFKLTIPEFDFPPQGESNAGKIPIIGASGAGKTTLLNVMGAIEWPHSGTVTWSFPDGTHITWKRQGLSNSEARKLRRRYFGYAFQESTLIPHLQVCDNLSYPLLFQGYSAKQAYNIVREALSRVLLRDEGDDIFERFPSHLSGGQRQRVALVQAMIHNPYVLFADEPTGSLDRGTRQQVMKVLYDWVSDTKHPGERLLFWITHHENDPRDSNAQWMIYVNSGVCEWKTCLTNKNSRDTKE